ncbi:hypothetical protein BKA69DRAFT_74094 [Paraphysoderma sedebokerense]|nr:hypothetical protein BKA69DRAFT_74094 [Paraphysoderma sedebokerense]
MINQFMIIGKIEEGDVETAKSMLLQFPKDAPVCSGDPWSQIAHKCVEHKQVEVLRFMLENGYKLHGCGGSLLRRALNECDEDMVKFLIEKGADSRDPTLLHQACEMGWSTMVEILLKNGSNVSWRTEATPQAITMGRKNENLSPLQVAARGAHFLDTSKYVHLAKLLIENGADVKELEEVTYGGTLLRKLKEREEQEAVRIWFTGGVLIKIPTLTRSIRILHAPLNPYHRF